MLLQNSDLLPGTRLAIAALNVNIRFTSTLTPEDENLVVPAVLKAFTNVLDLLPIAYAITIDTSDAHVYVHSQTEPATALARPVQTRAQMMSPPVGT
jgi:hypothetical protein